VKKGASQRSTRQASGGTSRRSPAGSFTGAPRAGAPGRRGSRSWPRRRRRSS
jgi:hypothetical protein